MVILFKSIFEKGILGSQHAPSIRWVKMRHLVIYGAFYFILYFMNGWNLKQLFPFFDKYFFPIGYIYIIGVVS